jgi:DNA/RNA-binding protein KIN17
MGKNEFLTPKAIANRIKAKGLQKLRWYCQMCQKQCRDENGFKCHCMSESHQRQMEVFGQNPDRIVEGYSEEFESTFLEHVKRTHRFSRVAATVVYNEYIADRHHVHMNSTQWPTLTDFIKYLGRTGKCKVDETPKGWFMAYIDREPETLLKEGLKNKRQRADVAEEERHERVLAEQIERAAKTAKPDVDQDDVKPEALIRDEAEEKLVFSLGSNSFLKPKVGRNGSGIPRPPKPSIFESGEPEESTAGRGTNGSRFGGQHGKNGHKGNGRDTLGQIIMEQVEPREKGNRKDYWLYEGLIVKVMSKGLADKGYYKQKGVVVRIIAKYVGEIKMLDSGDILKVDQEELETVLPQIGGLVRIVNGAYRDYNARLLSIDARKFSARVQIEGGKYDGREISAIEYEDICKLNTKS